MKTSMIVASALLAAISNASPMQIKARTPYAVKEYHPVPARWERVGPAPQTHRISLQIGLKQSSFDELEKRLYEVSDPSHERYGNHLSDTEVNDLVKPTDDCLDQVTEWLSQSGINTAELDYSPAKDWISVSLPVGDIEALLDTKYSIWQHEDGDYLVRTPEWSLPKHLHEHIEVIQPTNSFFRSRQLASTAKKVTHEMVEAAKAEASAAINAKAPAIYPYPADILTVCDVSLITPECLRTLYGTIDYVPKSAGKNKMGLNDFLNESNNRSDTHIFLEQYRPEAASAAYTFDVVIIANGNNEQTPENATELDAGKDLEGNLDSETMLGIGYPTPLTAFTTGGSPPFKPDLTTPEDDNEPYLVWVNYVLGLKTLPQVISTSYADDEQTIPYSYAKAVCNSFAQVGARGTSLFFGSGDSGVGTPGLCLTNDGKNTTTFLAMFPTSCPFVTAVGGTKFIPEVVATDTGNGYVSGGGFSRYFPRPSYQDAAVLPYLKTLPHNISSLYNKAGRAYPDIAAQGYRYATIWDGELAVLDGTSAATPAAAAIISLVNDALITAGKSPLGFLNPWLYAGGFEAFRDVTNGSVTGCDTDGFPTAKGWDAASGFGTPYFPAIVKNVLGRK